MVTEASNNTQIVRSRLRAHVHNINLIEDVNSIYHAEICTDHYMIRVRERELTADVEVSRT